MDDEMPASKAKLDEDLNGQRLDVAKDNAVEQGVLARLRGEPADGCPFSTAGPAKRWRQGWELGGKLLRPPAAAPTVEQAEPRVDRKERRDRWRFLLELVLAAAAVVTVVYLVREIKQQQQQNELLRGQSEEQRTQTELQRGQIERQRTQDELLQRHKATRILDTAWDLLGGEGGTESIVEFSSDPNQQELARRLIWEALELQPHSALPYLRQGGYFVAKGKYEEAEASFRRALIIEPEDSSAHTNLGVILAAQGRLEEAKASHSRALELNPNSAIAYNNLGAVYFKQSRFEDAEARFRKSLDINPNDVHTLYNLGLSFARLGKNPEAEASIRKALEIDPDDAALCYVLGTVLSAQGKHEEAEASFSAALRLEPKYEADHDALGESVREEIAPGDLYRQPLAASPFQHFVSIYLIVVSIALVFLSWLYLNRFWAGSPLIRRGQHYYLNGRPLRNGDKVEKRHGNSWRQVELKGMPAKLVGCYRSDETDLDPDALYRWIKSDRTRNRC